MADVQRLILATDMSRHAEYMRELRALLEAPAAPARPGPAEAGRRRRLTAELLIKCADTSNVLKPFPVAQRWAVRGRPAACRRCIVLFLEVARRASSAACGAGRDGAAGRQARITEEFFRQGDVERALGMEVTGCCDRRAATRVGLQRGFVAFIAPFYRGLGELLPGLGPVLGQLEETRAEWAAVGESDEWAEAEIRFCGSNCRDDVAAICT